MNDNKNDKRKNMNLKNIALILLLLLNAFTINADMISATATKQISDGFQTITDKFNFCVGHADYVAGGIVFTFPADMAFAQVPVITASVQLKNATFNSSIQFTAVVTQLSTTQVTIRVVKSQLLGLAPTEAATNDVTVQLVAMDNTPLVLLP